MPRKRAIYPCEVLKEKLSQLGIFSQKEYERYRDSLAKEERANWPREPNRAYEEPVFIYSKKYSAKELRVKLKKLGIWRMKQYLEYRRNLPEDERSRCPGDPNRVYGERFFKPVKIYSYAILRRRVREAGIRSFEKYWSYRDSLPDKEKARWPCDPHRTYGSRYDFEDLFGVPKHETKRLELCDLEELLKGVRELGIGSYEEYTRSLGRLSAVCGKKFPKSPRQAFGDLYDAGKVFIKGSPYHSYEMIKRIVKREDLRSHEEYQAYRSRLPEKKKSRYPHRLSYYPEYCAKALFKVRVYSQIELRQLIREAGIRGKEAYHAHRMSLALRERRRWPSNPEKTYGIAYSRAFYNIEDWEVNGYHPIPVLSRKARKLGATSIKSYRRMRSAIKDDQERAKWPIDLKKAYPDFNYYAFFGNRPPEDRFYPYETMKRKVHSFRLRTREQYREWKKNIKDPFERRRWPSQPREVYDQFDPDDFFYRPPKDKMSFKEAQEYLEQRKAVFVSDYKRLRKVEPRLPWDPAGFWRKNGKNSDQLFLYRRSGPLIKAGNIYYYELAEYQLFLRTNAILTRVQYLKARSRLPDEERKFYPTHPDQIYPRFYGTDDGIFENTDFFKLWGEFSSAAEMSQAVRALGVRSQKGFTKIVEEIPAFSVDPTSFGDWPGKLLGHTEKEAWEIFLGFYDHSLNYHPEEEREPRTSEMEPDAEPTDDDIAKMLAEMGDPVEAFDD